MKAVTSKSQLYLLVGDPFLRHQRLDGLIEKIKKDQASNSPSPYVAVYHADDFDPAEFIEEVKTFPFLSSQKVLVLKGTDLMKDAAKDMLAQCLRIIPSFTTIVMEAGEMAEGDPLYQWVHEKGIVEVSASGDRDEKIRFVKDTLRKSGKAIEGEAQELLYDLCGGDLGRLSESLKKIDLAAGSRKVIECDDVLRLADEGGEFDGFDLIFSMLRKDERRALKILNFLLDKVGQEPAEILGLFNWHFKRVKQAQDLLGEGRSAPDVVKQLRIPRYTQDSFLRQAKSFTQSKMRMLFEELFSLDWKIKRGMADAKVGLESFVIRFCG